MSDQNSTTPDPSDAVPGYQPPSASEPAAPATPPAYTPPPAFTPPPAAEPPAYSPPPAPTGGYEPPAAGGYAPPPTPGYPEPPAAFPPPPPGQFGAPQPPYPVAPAAAASVTGAPLADWPKRALGGLIDYVAAGVVIGIVTGILTNISYWLGTTVQWVLILGWYAYLGYKSGTTGVTFGRSLAKTKLISAETGQPIGVTNGIVRQLAHIVDTIICYIGWLFPLWDAQKQTLADKIMKTVVIDNSADPNASTYNWG